MGDKISPLRVSGPAKSRCKTRPISRETRTIRVESCYNVTALKCNSGQSSILILLSATNVTSHLPRRHFSTVHIVSPNSVSLRAEGRRYSGVRFQTPRKLGPRLLRDYFDAYRIRNTNNLRNNADNSISNFIVTRAGFCGKLRRTRLTRGMRRRTVKDRWTEKHCEMER